MLFSQAIKEWHFINMKFLLPFRGCDMAKTTASGFSEARGRVVLFRRWDRREPLHERFEARISSQRIP